MYDGANLVELFGLFGEWGKERRERVWRQGKERKEKRSSLTHFSLRPDDDVDVLATQDNFASRIAIHKRLGSAYIKTKGVSAL